MNIKFEEEKEEMKKKLEEQNEKINMLNNELKIQKDALSLHRKKEWRYLNLDMLIL